MDDITWISMESEKWESTLVTFLSDVSQQWGGEMVKALPHPKTVSANLGCSRAVPWSMPGRKMMVSLYPSFARPSSVRPLLLLVFGS
jgi:hypothetical protein